MYIWSAIDIEDQLSGLREKVNRITQELGMKTPVLSLPFHISLRISFPIPDELRDEVEDFMFAYLSSLPSFAIQVEGLEKSGNIIWIRMKESPDLRGLHEELCSLLQKRFDIRLQEFDRIFIFHSTLVFAEDELKTREAFSRLEKLEIPSTLFARKFAIGPAITGATGESAVRRVGFFKDEAVCCSIYDNPKNKANTDMTLDYYRNNAGLFSENTIGVDMSVLQNAFMELIPKGGKVLDLGCGTGRDSLYFREAGFRVFSIDGSNEMCGVASKLLGCEIIRATFEKYETNIVFDGIWACASLLHVEMSKLPHIVRKYAKMLRNNGIFYMSFKYGDFSGVRDGRYFTDINEERLKVLLSGIPELELVKCMTTRDGRPEHESELWLNAFCRKREQAVDDIGVQKM